MTINDGTFDFGVYGGYGSGYNAYAAQYNTLTINGGIFDGVYGGGSDYGDATNNNVTITDGIFDKGVYGGHSYYGRATGNILTIIEGNFSCRVFGGSGTEAENNTLTINGGTFNDWVEGGFSTNSDANYNTTIINGGSFSGCFFGGNSGDFDATGNTLTINGGTFNNSSIYGGFSADSSSDDSYKGKATGNTVNINGGTFNNSFVYGGCSWIVGDATDNTININNAPDLTKANLYGGYSSKIGTSSGNTLNIYTKDLIARNISDFQNINFYLPESTVNGDTILTLSSEYTDISGAAVKAGVVGNANLTEGDVITLMQNNGTITTDGTAYGTLTEGVSLNYDLAVSKSDDNKIIATVGKGSLNAGTEVLALSEVAGIGAVNNTMDTKTLPTDDDDNEDVSGSAGDASNVQIVEPKGWEIFANMGGGSLRTKGSDGSHVDMTTQSINLGFARSLEASKGRFTIAPIIDYAHGNYDSYLETGVHGNGSTRYIAGGLIARRILQNGFYYETSVRLGKVKTDFSSDHLGTSGQNVTYDASATTISGHLKLGKAFRLNKNNLLDVYGIYCHAHQNGMGADLSSGEHYDFSSANNGRFRMGYRLTTRTSKISKIYTGLAFQYEHSNGITATYKDYETPGAGESGSSGMLELGWIIKPLKNNPWAVDINTTGWIGHQRGITAMAKVVKSF